MSTCFEACILPNPSSTSNWECTKTNVGIRKIVEKKKDGFTSATQNGSVSNNVDKATSWMEEMEALYGGPGAYDVLRCDLSYDHDRLKMNHFIWGLEFHLNRLQMSFQDLLLHHGKIHEFKRHDEITGKDMIDGALTQSKTIIESLVHKVCEDYEKLLSCASKSSVDKASEDTKHIIIVKLTIFWAGTNSGSGTTCVNVRGHAFTDGKVVNPLTRPTHIVASLAIPSTYDEAIKDKRQHSIPNRLDSPQAKISSWSRERKVFQQQSTFKPNGVYEVLLLDTEIYSNLYNDWKSYDVLEGITSNFFAIYDDNTIRTATSKVLIGYIRHLVLEFADKCGLKLDPRPCKLEDARNGLWKEAFITSSSRLIYPIKQILIPKYEEISITKDDNNIHPTSFEELWRDKDFNEKTQINPKWELLLNEILNHGGYGVDKSKT